MSLPPFSPWGKLFFCYGSRQEPVAQRSWLSNIPCVEYTHPSTWHVRRHTVPSSLQPAAGCLSVIIRPLLTARPPCILEDGQRGMARLTLARLSSRISAAHPRVPTHCPCEDSTACAAAPSHLRFLVTLEALLTKCSGTGPRARAARSKQINLLSR
jgi:hypothetical protein